MADLGDIIRAYRAANSLSQSELAHILDVDQSYISKIERGQNVQNTKFLSRVADRLLISPFKLGLTQLGNDNDHELVKTGESSIRLAEIARLSGQSETTIREIQPLIWRLEALLASDPSSDAVRVALGRAKAVVGTALGDVLPRMKTEPAVTRLMEAYNLLRSGVSKGELVTVEIRLGNELRKIGRFEESAARLRSAQDGATSVNQRGAAAICLARLAAVRGDRRGFDAALRTVRASLDSSPALTPTFNPVAFEEVELRASIEFGFLSDKRLATASASASIGLAPQWAVIRSVTLANALLSIQDHQSAVRLIEEALFAAEIYTLPQQISRLISIVQRHGRDNDRALLLKLQSTLSRLSNKAHLLLE